MFCGLHADRSSVRGRVAGSTCAGSTPQAAEKQRVSFRFHGSLLLAMRCSERIFRWYVIKIVAWSRFKRLRQPFSTVCDRHMLNLGLAGRGGAIYAVLAQPLLHVLTTDLHVLPASWGGLPLKEGGLRGGEVAEPLLRRLCTPLAPAQLPVRVVQLAQPGPGGR